MKNHRLLTPEETAFLMEAFTRFLTGALTHHQEDLRRVLDHLSAHPDTVALTLDVSGGNLWPSLDPEMHTDAATFTAEVFPDLPFPEGLSGADLTFHAEAYFTEMERIFARLTAHELPAADGVARQWTAPYGTVYLGNLQGLRLTVARPWKALPDPAPWHPEHTGLMVAPNPGERFDLGADLLITRHLPVPMGMQRFERRVTYVGVQGEVLVRPPAAPVPHGHYPVSPDLRAPTRLEWQLLQAKVAQDPELRAQFRAMTGVHLEADMS